MTQQGKRLESLRSWGNVPDANYNEAIVAAGRVAGGVGPGTVDASGAEMAIHRAIGAKGQTDLQDLRANTALRLGASNWASVGELSTGEPQLPSSGFDFVGPPWTGDGNPPNSAQANFDGPWEQLNAVVGMRGVDSLSYAPHALQAVWSEPVNVLQYPNKFDEVSVWALNAATVSKVNETDWAFTMGLDGKVQQITSQDPDIVNSISVELPEGGDADFLLMQITESGGANKCMVWFDFNNRTITETRVVGSGVIASTSFSGLKLRMAGSLPGASDYQWWIRPVVASGSETAAADGTQFLFRNAMSYPGDVDLPFQDNDGVAALDNWASSSGALSPFFLAYEKKQVWYCLDNSASGVIDNRRIVGDYVPANIPMSMRLRAWGTGQVVIRPGSNAAGDSLRITLTDTPTVYELKSAKSLTSTNNLMHVEADPGAIVYWDEPENVEGPSFFDLKTEGAARYLLRNERGVGRLSEPDVENKCQNFSVSPTDTTNIADGVNASTSVVARASLPLEIQSALDLEDPDGTITAMYRTQFSGNGRAYAVGPTGNTNEHFVRALIWSVSGNPLGGVALETQDIAPVLAGDTLAWVGGKGAPLAATDRMGVFGNNGTDLYWIANMLHEGSVERSHIPVAGSNRTRSADKPIAATDELGIDRRRNSIPQSSNQGASLGPISGSGSVPDGWTLVETNGWTAIITDIGVDYFSVRLQAETPTGPVRIDPVTTTTIPASTGDTRRTAAEYQIVGGSTANLTAIGLEIQERDSGGGFLGGSTLPILNIVSSELRRFESSRTFSQGTTAHSYVTLGLDGSGPCDITLKIRNWSEQESNELLPHIETTGTAIEYQQWVDGLTVVDVWDVPSDTGDNKRFWEAYGSDRVTNRVEALGGAGASSANGLLRVTKDGSTQATTATESVIGLHTQQSALKEGDQEYWIDGASQGTLTSGMPIDMDKWILGDQDVAANNNRDGVQKRLAFYGYRASGAL